MDKLAILRHSTSHVLAAAVLEMFPEAKFAIGPSIDDGFYYDFELPRTLIPEDLALIEKKMKHIIKQNLPFEKEMMDRKEAIKLFKKAKQDYKVELLEELKDKKISIYKTGKFVDLCTGPHIDSTGEIDKNAFKLTKIAGAYWRGDEKNKMLQRIYGTVFESKKALDEYLKKEKEAKDRDHRKLGKEMDLWTFSEMVGAGLPLYTPKGTAIRDELQKIIIEMGREFGYEKVTIPQMAKRKLYETSGHAEKFGEELLQVKSKYDKFVLKPVNCPHHTQIYASQLRSYKDLPIRYMESGLTHRDEKPGEIGGLTRTRSFLVDDGHVFCAMDQVKDEAKNLCKLIEKFYKSVGLWGNHWVSLSIRDPKDFSKYIGNEKDWKKAEGMLEDITKELKLGAKKMEGEAAIYGPKIDYMFTDSLGRERQLATVQIDFAMPQRFKLTYVDEKGKKETPVMVHRAILGSYERFLAIMLEHFGGALPLWMASTHAAILPVSKKFNKYAEEVKEKLDSELVEANIDPRIEVDDSDETLGKKIRNNEKLHVPYLLVVGEKEKKATSVNVRIRDKKDQKMIKLDAFANLMEEKIKKRELNL